MAKLPYDIGSVYEVKKASAYTNGSNRMHVIAGDRLVFRNKSERYAIIEIKNITTKTSSAEQSANGLGDYQYEVEFDYFVNVSVNSYERDIFRPTETNLTVPTLIFKTDVRELFNSTIKRLELINSMMEKNGDLEYRETTNAEIAVLNQKNSDFYLFNELDKIKSIQYSLSTTRKKIFDTFSLNVDYDDITFENRLQKFSKHLNSTRNFKDYMRTINAYNFKQNIVDLDILIQLYKMQQISLEIIIDTFTYKSHDISFFVERLKKLTLFDTATFIDKKEKNYGKILVNLVKKLRELFFRIKLIINFPIMTSDRYLIMDSDYKRLKSDLSTNIWKNEEENDLFLLHKKLEMVYGFEVGKVEEGNDYISLISDVVLVSKNTFGNGLSIDDRKELSTYIQKIESLAVSEYDDFFMLSLWLDYLEKNV